MKNNNFFTCKKSFFQRTFFLIVVLLILSLVFSPFLFLRSIRADEPVLKNAAESNLAEARAENEADTGAKSLENVEDLPPVENNKFRLHFAASLIPEGDLANLGLWLWNGANYEMKSWPSDALSLKDAKKTSFGYYIDIDKKSDATRISYLLVNKNEHGDDKIKLTKDNQHIYLYGLKKNEIFIGEGYKIHPEKPSSTNKNFNELNLEAKINREISSEETAVLSLSWDKEFDSKITKIEVDASSIGDEKNLEVDKEVKKISLRATHDKIPGEYDINVTAYGQGEEKSTKTVKLKIKEAKQDIINFDEQRIYFMVTDRFYDGDKNNNNPYNLNYATAKNQRGVYRGGDFRGVIEKLDYLKKLGITSIWITPIVENVGFDASHGTTNGEYYAYHGYWASNFENLNPHLGSMEDFHELIDKAKEKGINIIVDVVLNHAGYGMDGKGSKDAPKFPKEDELTKFRGMFREEDEKNGEIKKSLNGLPDFRTEDMLVRDQLVKWQKAWLTKTKTKKGNSIYAYRVDTVVNVDKPTWQHFKNELALEDPNFKLIGESWAASYKNTNGHLGHGMMDSLLDFGFKDIAHKFVNNQLEEAAKMLIERNKFLKSSHTLGQFLSSHDEDGFLYKERYDTAKQKLAASLQIMAKGQPVIYYGEELGQSGANNWPIYDNRYDFAWDKIENNEMLAHYQKLLELRNKYSKLLARGEIEKHAGSDTDSFMVFKRSHEGQTAYLAYNSEIRQRNLIFKANDASQAITDEYSGKTYKAKQDKDGNNYISVPLPASTKGGFAFLKPTQGDLAVQNVEEVDDLTTDENIKPVPEGYLRLHFKKLPNSNLDQVKIWLWGDVAIPSENVAKWPQGSSSFKPEERDSYGQYIDVKLKDKYLDKIGFHLLSPDGRKYTNEDKYVYILSQEMKEIWLDENYRSYAYRPLAKKNTIRLNYQRKDKNYENLGPGIWGDVVTKSEDLGAWAEGASLLNEHLKEGRYLDVALNKNPNLFGFLIVNKQTKQKTQENNYEFRDLANHSQVFVRDDDPKIYTNPYFVDEVRLRGGLLKSLTSLEAGFTTLTGKDEESLKKELKLKNKNGQDVEIKNLKIQGEKAIITADFKEEAMPYTLSYTNGSFKILPSFELKDELYAYNGELGAKLSEEGTKASLKFWSPSADKVSLVIYDKDDNEKIVLTKELTKTEKGLWQLDLTASETNGKIKDFKNYLYHYLIERDGKYFLVLDPYAKSLGAWNSETPMTEAEKEAFGKIKPDFKDKFSSKKVAKAAFVSPEKLGPELTYANIPNFKEREDAIIYEAHVRDFTSDPKLEGKLTKPFGTFGAFIDKLDYLKGLGVTHIQLLPLMSYYFANELKRHERELNYSSKNNNYNWGYDPQHYFSLSGMYSEKPQDPSSRIEEFKKLVAAIHAKGMGVILDVVYNHTGQTHILEDLEPNYYHYMNADASPRENFGGGRLGTSHKMARRILVDSIKYLTSEFKVDGFRFDMMGDQEAEVIEEAFNEAKKLNPKIIMLGEGWRSYVGDENKPLKPANQDWMAETDTVAVFSDDIRNELKSGYGSEGQARFLTGAARSIRTIFNNIKAQPTNFNADDPGDVIQYISAHDNLTLFDVIAHSLKKDPSVPRNNEEILRRIRLGNGMILTSQGTPFIHSGQEYGRTKQFLAKDYESLVAKDKEPYKSTIGRDVYGSPFSYPYFIHDSYDSSDIINRFDWAKTKDKNLYKENVKTYQYTKGLILLRRSTDAFSLKTRSSVDENVKLLSHDGNDSFLAFFTKGSHGDEYLVLINAGNDERSFDLRNGYERFSEAKVLVDAEKAGAMAISEPQGLKINGNTLRLEGLSMAVLRLGEPPHVLPEVEEKDEMSPETEILPPADKITSRPFGQQKGEEKLELSYLTDLGMVKVLVSKSEAQKYDIQKLIVKDLNSSIDIKKDEGRYQLYDIHLLNSRGEIIKHFDDDFTAEVMLALDSRRSFKTVKYFPNPKDYANAKSLPSSEVILNGKKYRSFLAKHFSVYGIEYHSSLTKTKDRQPNTAAKTIYMLSVLSFAIILAIYRKISYA